MELNIYPIQLNGKLYVSDNVSGVCNLKVIDLLKERKALQGAKNGNY